MPNQSGKIVLVLVLLFLILGALAYFFLPASQQNNNRVLPSPSTQSRTSSEIENLAKCNTEFDDDINTDLGIWEYLPDDIKEETYKNGKISEGEATYLIYLLRRSGDCKYIAFMIELVARGAGAYDKEDYQKRALYIFDSETKKITHVIKIPEDAFLDRKEYGSNSWSIDNKYKFVISEDTKQGEFIGRRYEYDTKNRELKDLVTEL